MLRKGVAILMLFLCLATLATLFTTQVHAAAVTTAVKGTSMASCQVLEAIPHGSQPATYKCLEEKESKATTASPNATLCGNILTLYWDANGKGASVCFSLAGEYDMTNISTASGGTWNDEASSYKTTCSYVTFYTDIQEGGSNVTVGLNSGIRNFTPGAVPNDSLSSVYIHTTCAD